MAVRRQIYLDDVDDRMLKEQSRRTGLSISELVRRALHKTYGLGPRLTWDEYLALPRPEIGSAKHPLTSFDPLFAGDEEDLIDREMDAFERERQSG